MPLLREVQDAEGFVSEERMHEIAGLCGTTTAEVRSVMSFYSTYHTVPTGKYHLQVCSTLMCALAGSDELWDTLVAELDVQSGEVTPDGRFSVQKVAPTEKPAEKPIVSVLDHRFKPTLYARLGQKDSWTLRSYLADGGYQAVRRAFAMGPDAVIEEVKKSGLRGRGGAGFATGLKWSFMPLNDGRQHIVLCNADESEPGTFKDRYLMSEDPHQLIEGMMIGGFAMRVVSGIPS